MAYPGHLACQKQEVYLPSPDHPGIQEEEDGSSLEEQLHFATIQS